MKIARDTLIYGFNRLSIGLVIILGLMAIVGTGKDNGSTSNTAPVAKIVSPTSNTVFQLKNSITFTGAAIDSSGNALLGTSLNWVSSLDGKIGSGSNFTVDSLSRGTHEITLTAIDGKGLADSTSISITVNTATNTLPIATITSPKTGTTFNYKDFIKFTGTGYDAEDGNLTGLSLVWYSNKDGQLGTGQSLDTTHLSSGTHTISLTATDSQNTSNTASITVIVNNTPPIAKINNPVTGATYAHGTSISFDGSGTDAEDGNLTGLSLVWTASNYGVIGTGTNITVDYLPAGTNIVINLRAVDSGGLVDSDSITLTITP